jgi:hypothetical protein
MGGLISSKKYFMNSEHLTSSVEIAREEINDYFDKKEPNLVISAKDAYNKTLDSESFLRSYDVSLFFKQINESCEKGLFYCYIEDDVLQNLFHTKKEIRGILELNGFTIKIKNLHC